MELKYTKGEISNSFESKLYVSDEKNLNFDYLIMLDSRGLVNKNDTMYKETYLYLLKKRLELMGNSYMIFSRPKYLTVFASLYNFLCVNRNLSFKFLITNLGFVDCTPKKQENIDDILLQVQQYSIIKNLIIEHEIYKLNSGKSEILKSIKYSEEYMDELSDLLGRKFDKCYFINTPIVSKSIKIERERPQSFFTQLKETNILIDNIVSKNKNKFTLIDTEEIVDTYDGVHYTTEGHKKIFNKIKESINL